MSNFTKIRSAVVMCRQPWPNQSTDFRSDVKNMPKTADEKLQTILFADCFVIGTFTLTTSDISEASCWLNFNYCSYN
jgi:hypothetical protein